MTGFPRWRPRLLIGTLSLIVLVAAGSATPTAAAGRSAAGTGDRPEFTTCAGLDAVAECGDLTVPLDRSDPAAGTTRVAFALIRHRDAALPSQGTIFYNPGGPGETVVEQASSLVAMFGPLLDRRDLPLVDLRGSGLSAPPARTTGRTRSPPTSTPCARPSASTGSTCGASRTARTWPRCTPRATRSGCARWC